MPPRPRAGPAVIAGVLDGSLDALGRLLWHARLSRWVFRIGRRNPKVILYHACEPTESPFIRDLGVNTPPEEFAAHLDFLHRHYQVVAVDELAAGTAPPNAAVITFDDGYRSVLEHAAPLLEARGMPATVYLVTHVVDNDDLVWVNELNWLLVTHPAETAPIVTEQLGLPLATPSDEVVAAVLQRYEPALVQRLLTAMWAAVPSSRNEVLATLELYLRWDEIRDMEGRRFSFGSHSATHPNLRGLEPADVAREVDTSVETMVRELGSCGSFAYPFGFTEERITAALQSRNFSSVMVVGGSNYGAQPTAIARTPLTGTSPAVLFSQLEVVEPAKAGLRVAAGWVRRRRRRAR
ncbi:MAG TPA: polysaccharide deacetylase family protein [Actinomycetota bacterium]|nr:polysaccharide deacetylase family protein [Actinomycetota bacterium]